jgi:hypothetical protein
MGLVEVATTPVTSFKPLVLTEPGKVLRVKSRAFVAGAVPVHVRVINDGLCVVCVCVCLCFSVFVCLWLCVSVSVPKLAFVCLLCVFRPMVAMPTIL